MTALYARVIALLLSLLMHVTLLGYLLYRPDLRMADNRLAASTAAMPEAGLMTIWLADTSPDKSSSAFNSAHTRSSKKPFHHRHAAGSTMNPASKQSPSQHSNKSDSPAPAAVKKTVSRKNSATVIKKPIPGYSKPIPQPEQITASSDRANTRPPASGQPVPAVASSAWQIKNLNPIAAAQRSSPDSDSSQLASEIYQALQKQISYPAAALKQRLSGTVIMQFKLSDPGHFAYIRVVKSSGFSLLDRHASRIIRQAGDTIPEQAIGIEIRVPMVFSMTASPP